MHDVVAHSLAVVIAQADGARYARASDPSAVDDALSAISSTSREALADVRILLSQLRHSEGETPQPTLADLERLLDQLSSSGLVIIRSETGVAESLAAGQQLAVYRVVQEALTNVLRHGDTTEPARLNFGWDPEGLTITVASAIRAEVLVPPNPVGHGLAGMRERATLAGGTFAAVQDGDRYVVTARLPILLKVALS
jgi:signal transduction histidine kinase